MPNVISILISDFQIVWPRLPWRRIFGTTKIISNIWVFTNVLFLLLILELRTWCIPPQTGNSSVLFACKQYNDTLIVPNRISIYNTKLLIIGYLSQHTFNVFVSTKYVICWYTLFICIRVTNELNWIGLLENAIDRI